MKNNHKDHKNTDRLYGTVKVQQLVYSVPGILRKYGNFVVKRKGIQVLMQWKVWNSTYLVSSNLIYEKRNSFGLVVKKGLFFF